MFSFTARPSVRPSTRSPGRRRLPPLYLEALDARITPTTLDQVFDPAGAVTVSTSVNYQDFTSEAAQTFPVGITGTLTEVDLYARRFGPGTTGDLIVDVRGTDANGVPTTGQELLTTTVPFASIPTTLGFIAVDVSSFNLQVTQGEQLAVVIHAAPDAGADTTYQWNGRNDNSYANGGFYARNGSSSGWQILDANEDLGFKTFVDPAPDQPPVVTLPGGPVSYTENAPPVVLAPSATVSDADSADFDTGVLTASLTANGTAADRLGIQNLGMGTGQIGVSGTDVTYQGTTIGTLAGGTGTTPLTVTLNASATPTAVQALVESLTFANVSDDPSTLDRTIQVTLSDGDGGTSSPVTTTMTVTATDDPPTVSTDAGLSLSRGTSATITRADLEATDPDNTPDQLTYTVTAAPAHGAILLNGSPAATFTQADVNNNLVAYQNDGSVAASDAFSFTVSDGTLATQATGFAITVTEQPPAVTTDTGMTVNEGGGAPITRQELEATDPDNTPDQLTYTVSAGPAHGTLLLNGNPASGFTQADINAGNVSYANDGSPATSDAFTFTVSDGQLATGPSTFAITVNTANQPPRVATNAGLVVAKGATAPIGTGVLDTVDPDNTSSQLVYTVSIGPAHGTLQVHGQAVTSFTQADIDAGRVGYVNDDSASMTDAITFTVSDGTVSTSPATFDIAVDTAPQVTTSPADVSAFAGSPVTLTAAATGTPAPTVQWQVRRPGGSFADIPGATAASYTFLPTPADAGSQYQAVFTNPVGSVTSGAATLTVTPGLVILSEPASQTVPLGQAATFTAGATGSTKVAVQWQVSTDGGTTWTNVGGATRSTLVVKGVSAAQDGALYRAVFRDAAGQAASAPATLTVNSTVTLAGKRTVTVRPGTAVTLAVQAKATPTAVQWQVSTDGGKMWATVPGATEVTYTFVPTATVPATEYRADVSVGTKTAPSPAATVVVIDPPTVTASPTDQAVAVGLPATFTAGAVGTGVKLQWQVSTDGGQTFTAVRGATKSTLVLKKATAAMNGWVYRAVFTNATGMTESAPATLTVT